MACIQEELIIINCLKFKNISLPLNFGIENINLGSFKSSFCQRVTFVIFAQHESMNNINGKVNFP